MGKLNHFHCVFSIEIPSWKLHVCICDCTHYNLLTQPTHIHNRRRENWGKETRQENDVEWGIQVGLKRMRGWSRKHTSSQIHSYHFCALVSSRKILFQWKTKWKWKATEFSHYLLLLIKFVADKTPSLLQTNNKRKLENVQQQLKQQQFFFHFSALTVNVTSARVARDIFDFISYFEKSKLN